MNNTAVVGGSLVFFEKLPLLGCDKDDLVNYVAAMNSNSKWATNTAGYGRLVTSFVDGILVTASSPGGGDGNFLSLMETIKAVNKSSPIPVLSGVAHHVSIGCICLAIHPSPFPRLTRCYIYPSSISVQWTISTRPCEVTTNSFPSPSSMRTPPPRRMATCISRKGMPNI